MKTYMVHLDENGEFIFAIPSAGNPAQVDNVLENDGSYSYRVVARDEPEAAEVAKTRYAKRLGEAYVTKKVYSRLSKIPYDSIADDPKATYVEMVNTLVWFILPYGAFIRNFIIDPEITLDYENEKVYLYAKIDILKSKWDEVGSSVLRDYEYK